MLDRARDRAARAARRSARLRSTSVVLWDHRSAPLPALESAHAIRFGQPLRRAAAANASARRRPETPDDARRNRGRAAISRAARHSDARAASSSTAAACRRTIASPRSRSARLLADRRAVALPAAAARRPRGNARGLRFHDGARSRSRKERAPLGRLGARRDTSTTLHHGRVAFAFLIDGSPGDPDAAIVRAVDRLAAFLRIEMLD